MTATTLDTAPSALTGRGGLVVSYERVSKFRATNVDATVVRGVSRQAEDAEDLAEARGLGPVIHLDGDEGISASRFETRERGDWSRLLGMVRGGEVSHVLVWLLDRIIRQTRDLDDLLDACRASGAVIIQTGTGSTVHPDDPDSIAMAKVSAVIAETEVAKMSKRQKRKQLSLAQNGRPHGGRRVFGYTDGMAALDPAEAAAVRAVVQRVLHGESLASCARWLNDEGYRGTSGSAWSGPNLGTYLRRPSLAGRRVHLGQDMGEATWPALISLGDHRALLVHLDNPARRTSPSNARVHLLSGMALCGKCGAALLGAPGGRGRGLLGAVYRCPSCHGVQRATAQVDQMVEDWMVERLGRSDARGALVDDTAGVELASLVRAADALAARRREVVQHQAVTGSMSVADYADTLAAMDAEASRLASLVQVQEAAVAAPERALEGLTGQGAAEAWAALTGPEGLARKRAAIKVLCTVTVHPAARRGAPFSRESVTVAPVGG